MFISLQFDTNFIRIYKNMTDIWPSIKGLYQISTYLTFDQIFLLEINCKRSPQRSPGTLLNTFMVDVIQLQKFPTHFTL